MTSRSAEIHRSTKETEIHLRLDLDGSGNASVATGVGFLDHMLNLFAKHGLFDLDVNCKGDLQIDAHHTTEDIGIALGSAIEKALGDKSGIRRYGHSILPMDETLVTVAVDLGGRPFWVWNVPIPMPKVGEFDTELAADFWHAVAMNGRMNFHAQLQYGRNSHHIIEAVFKAAARAIRQACEQDARATGVPSTKGTLSS